MVVVLSHIMRMFLPVHRRKIRAFQMTNSSFWLMWSAASSGVQRPFQELWPATMPHPELEASVKISTCGVVGRKHWPFQDCKRSIHHKSSSFAEVDKASRWFHDL